MSSKPIGLKQWAGIFGLLCLSTGAVAQTAYLSIATAGMTGVFYGYGGAIANVVSKSVPDISMVAESTGGTVENIKMLSKGQANLATVSSDVVFEATSGSAQSRHFRKKVELYGLFNMYPQPHHVVTLRGSPITNVDQIRGKRVVVGAPGSGTEVKTRQVLEALGITYDDFTPEFLTFAEGAEALQDGNVDAAFLGVTYPSPALVSLALTNPFDLVSFDDGQISVIHKKYPYLIPSTIPADTYRGVPHDARTVSVQTLVVTNKSLTDEQAYAIVKAVFDHKTELEGINHAFSLTTLRNAAHTSIPLHPGAARYFREVGAL